ncbi:MAG: flavodoxin [Campylobacteraceae bacterium]|jgi:flavodoxin I|nr:flavodoxin [Campylobacteraceae bacterium]
MSLAIVYGSTKGTTARVAELIKSRFEGADLINIAQAKPDELNRYDGFIFGTSTWYDGELQDDWEEFDKNAIKVEGKPVALFGIGNQKRHGETFSNGIGILHELFSKNGAKIIGDKNPTDGYVFEKSKAVVDGKFVGLIIDQEFPDDLAKEYVAKWTSSIKDNFAI